MKEEDAIKAALKRFKNAWSNPRDPARIWGTTVSIEKVWNEFPDLRLGQMLVSAIGKERLFNIEDEQLIKELKEWAEAVTE